MSLVVQTGTSVIAPGLSVTVCGAVGPRRSNVDPFCPACDIGVNACTCEFGPPDDRYDAFIEALTAKLSAAGVPAMPTWPDAIDWLIERAREDKARRAM